MFILPNTYKLYKKQYQCGDCKYMGYTDCIYGYLCCNPSVKEKHDPNKIHTHKAMWFKRGINVQYANPNGKCQYYKKSYIKWLSKWNTKRDYTYFW